LGAAAELAYSLPQALTQLTEALRRSLTVFDIYDHDREPADNSIATATHEAHRETITKTSRTHGVSYPVTAAIHGMLTPMAKSRITHKGERDQILAPVVEDVYTELATLAADHGTSISQISADLLAIATGYHELVRELHQTVLPQPRPDSPKSHAPSGSLRPTKIRVPRRVYAHIREQAVMRGVEAGPLSADLLAIACGHPELVRDLDKEVLRLAM
jgi:Flp pilus assembly protein TadG